MSSAAEPSRAPRHATGTPPSIVVIGLGEENRSEDRVGLEVVRQLRSGPPIAAELLTWEGEPTALLDRWEGVDAAIVVDAVRSGAPLGSLSRWAGEEAAGLAASPASTSTHGLSLAHAIGLGAALARLPRTLIVFGVEVGDLRPGRRVGPAVDAGIRAAAEAIRREVVSRASGSAPGGSIHA